MEILYVTIHLAIVTKGFAFNFGSIIQTLPPAFPEDFRKKILDIYSKNPEAFGDSVAKGAPHSKIMKPHKVQHMANALRNEDKTDKPVTNAPQNTPALPPGLATLSSMQIPPMPIPPMPMPIPIPVPMYPQMPIVLPMRTYFERVIHQHPPLEKIKQIIAEDEERWAKYGKAKIEKHSSETDSDSSDTDSSSRHFDRWQYYDDFLHIKG